MEELGLWNFLHGTGAGCASIMAWETANKYLTGAAAMGVFLVITLGIMHAVHRHQKYLRKPSKP